MITRNYFEFYEMPVAFYIDDAALKRAFYAKSKAFHPDFHTLADDETQDFALEMASFNSEAYKTLSNFDARLEYILRLNNQLGEEGQEKMPQDFLMEMMELNELIMDLEFDFDKEKYEQAKKISQDIEREAFSEVEATLKNFNVATASEDDYKKIKNFHLKNKYLLRIQKSLSTFAPH